VDVLAAHRRRQRGERFAGRAVGVERLPQIVRHHVELRVGGQ